MKDKISNKIIMGAMRLLSFFFFPDRDVDEIFAHAKTHNEKQSFKLPKSRKIEYEDLKICTENGTYHCLRIRRKTRTKACYSLYLRWWWSVRLLSASTFSC